MNNNFIVVEGLDYSGKTTICKFLEDKFRESNKKNNFYKDIVLTRQPGGIKNNIQIREILKNNRYNSLSELFLFLADRAEHSIDITKLLINNNLVISDRYYFSTLAYQGARTDLIEKISFEHLLQLNRLSCNYIEPFVLFYCDCDMSTIENRLKYNCRQEKWENFEQINFLSLVKDKFEYVLDNSVSGNIKIIRIDTNKTIEHSLEQVSSILNNLKLL